MGLYDIKNKFIYLILQINGENNKKYLYDQSVKILIMFNFGEYNGIEQDLWYILILLQIYFTWDSYYFSTSF